MQLRKNFRHTMIACYIGYITQAITVNFASLLFITFQKSFEISLEKIGFLVTINFVIQLTVDFLAAKYVDRLGQRRCIVAAHFLCAAGLVGLGVFPDLFPSPYAGLVTATALYAVGGGLIEVLVSPMIEACPTERKSASMSLLHSFYCWGYVFLVLASTLFFVLFGTENWRILAIIWAVIPFFNAFYFTQVPLAPVESDHSTGGIRGLFKLKLFWILAVLMVCAGAAEQAMGQWASAFAEAGLRVSKTIGDLTGPCMFAMLMGITRLFYSKVSEKYKLENFMLGCGLLCIAGYLTATLSGSPVLSLVGCGMCGLAVGIMWPGTVSISAKAIPKGGTAMFALLALSGDLGCSMGPGLVGTVSDAAKGGLKTGLLAAIAFPILLVMGLVALKLYKRKRV